MELHQLRYVVAVAETGNFTRAAERSNITQPSLSQQIINLEREIGHRLFHRLGRKAVVTEAGAAFLDRARRILFEVENAAKELKDSPGLDRVITVGAIPTVGPVLLPRLIAVARHRFPNLEVHVREDFRGPLISAVIEGELDLAIVSLPVKETRLSIEALVTEPLRLVLHKTHPLATRPEVRGADLADQSFIMMGNASSLTEQVQAFCGEHNFMPRIAGRCAQVATVKSLVALNAGISILPESTRSKADRETLVYKSLTGRRSPLRELAVIRHLQRYQSRGSEQFLRLLRDEAQGIMTGE